MVSKNGFINPDSKYPDFTLLQKIYCFIAKGHKYANFNYETLGSEATKPKLQVRYAI